MQTLEALISFTFFLFFATYLLGQLDYAKPNYALYEYQVANDIWRVLYLKGDLSDYPARQQQLETDMQTIKQISGYCAYIEGVKATAASCRAPFTAGCSANRITAEKGWFENSAAASVRFTVCAPQ